MPSGKIAVKMTGHKVQMGPWSHREDTALWVGGGYAESRLHIAHVTESVVIKKNGRRTSQEMHKSLLALSSTYVSLVRVLVPRSG